MKKIRKIEQIKPNFNQKNSDPLNLFYRKAVKKFPNDSNLKTINESG